MRFVILPRRPELSRRQFEQLYGRRTRNPQRIVIRTTSDMTPVDHVHQSIGAIEYPVIVVTIMTAEPC